MKSGDTTPCRMTGVTLHKVTPVILHGVVSPNEKREEEECNEVDDRGVPRAVQPCDCVGDSRLP